MPIIVLFTRSMESTTKNLYFFGALSTLVWMYGGLFKMLHWPAAGVLLTLGTASLIMFLVLYALKLNKE